MSHSRSPSRLRAQLNRFVDEASPNRSLVGVRLRVPLVCDRRRGTLRRDEHGNADRTALYSLAPLSRLGERNVRVAGRRWPAATAHPARCLHWAVRADPCGHTGTHFYASASRIVRSPLLGADPTPTDASGSSRTYRLVRDTDSSCSKRLAIWSSDRMTFSASYVPAATATIDTRNLLAGYLMALSAARWSREPQDRIY